MLPIRPFLNAAQISSVGSERLFPKKTIRRLLRIEEICDSSQCQRKRPGNSSVPQFRRDLKLAKLS
jgi:hypothetical protein